MSRPANTSNWGYKVTTRNISVNQLVRDAEGAEYDLPYYIYEFGEGTRRFVSYQPYDWTANT